MNKELSPEDKLLKEIFGDNYKTEAEQEEEIERKTSSVSDEDFQRMWGKPIDEHTAEMMKWVVKVEAKDFEHDGFIRRLLEYRNRINDHRRQIMRIKKERKLFIASYAYRCLEASGYKIGDPYRDEHGNLFYVSGVYEHRGDIFLSFNKSNKDGNMSKNSAMGAGMPYVNISLQKKDNNNNKSK